MRKKMQVGMEKSSMDLAKQRAKRGKSKRCCNEMKQATGRVYIHVLKILSLGSLDAVRIKNKNKGKKENKKQKIRNNTKSAR